MGEEFLVSTNYPGYVFVGCAEGQFQPEGGGDKRSYYNMYVLSPVSGYESEDYKASGMKAEKKKCLSSDVWKDRAALRLCAAEAAAQKISGALRGL